MDLLDPDITQENSGSIEKKRKSIIIQQECFFTNPMFSIYENVYIQKICNDEIKKLLSDNFARNFITTLFLFKPVYFTLLISRGIINI